MNDALTLLNILQALTLVFVHGLSFDAPAEAMDANDVADARNVWDMFTSGKPGDEFIVDGHRLVVQ